MGAPRWAPRGAERALGPGRGQPQARGRPPATSRTGVAALIAIALSGSGCGGEAVLELPAVEGVERWLIVVSAPEGLRHLEVVDASAPFRAGVDSDAGLVIEALGFAGELRSVDVGPLAVLTAGADLPAPRASFAADLDARQWREAPPSASARTVRLPPLDDCRPLTADHELIGDRGQPVLSMSRQSGEQQLVITADRWFVANTVVAGPLAPLVPGGAASGRDPSGSTWVANAEAVWSVYSRSGITATVTRDLPLLPGYEPIALAAPKPSRVFGLTADGRLFATDSSTTVVVYRFPPIATATSGRGRVVVDSMGVLAAWGDQSTVVRVDDFDRVTELHLPDPTEGVTAIARFGAYGIVVGTDRGLLRSQQHDFEPIADPRGTIPPGTAIRAIEPREDWLFFGGDGGLFGQVTPRGFVCATPGLAASDVRFVAEMGATMMVAGAPLPGQSEVHLTRVRVAY